MALTLSELKSKLTPQQLAAAELLVANDFAGKEKKTYQEIAEELEIDARTLYNWRHTPAFIRYCATLSDSKLDSYRSVADAQLMKLIAGTSNNGIPSIKALELFYKLNGKLVERREVVQTEELNRPKRMSDEELQRGLEEMNKMLQ